MKTRSTLFLICWIASLLVFPAGAQPTTPATALLVGHVASPTLDTISVTLRRSRFDSQEHTTYARLDAKGDFQLQVPVSGYVLADLVYGDATVDLYLDGSTSLNAQFKGSDMPGTIKFKLGKAEAGTAELAHQLQMVNANAYLADFDAEFVANDGYQVLPENILLYEAPFVSFLNYRLKHEMEFLEDRAEKDAFTPEFYNYAKAQITYSNADDRLTFPDLREQVVSSEQRLKMTSGYFDFLESADLFNNPAATQNEQYQEFLLNYIHFLAGQQKHKRTDTDFLVACYSLATKRLSGEARLLTLGRLLQESFRFGHMRQSEAMLADFTALDKEQKYASFLQKDFNQRKSLVVGAAAPDFRLLSSSGDTVKLSSLRGKLVYLNFWKSTNGLCQRDFPFAKDLQQRFEGKNVVFVHINLDEQETVWRQLVEAKSLPGVQLHAVGGMQAAVASAYHIANAPTYMLLGEDGTILITKPRGLSSRATVEELNESFGKAGTYTAALALLSGTASTTK